MISPLILLMTVLRIALKVALCFLVADLIVGFVHWAEDSYGSPEWPLIGASIIAPNLLHHAKPRAFLENSWWQSANLQVVVGALVLALAGLCDLLSAELALVVVLSVNANEIHRWAHRSKTENGRLITWLQNAKLIQSRAHHGRHHGGQRNSAYCAITAWVDPLLDHLGLWRGLERLIWLATGTLPRIDPALAQRAMH